MKKKVLLGMSGGVDSSVAALFLLEKGYDVTGVTMKLQSDIFMKENISNECCSLDDIDDARRVAYKLGIDHIVMNFVKEFENNVISNFVSEYQNGKTPNPCIICNQKIKFESFLNKAMALDYDYISTGHYAVIDYDKKIKRWLLKKSKSQKDQSYVLYGMKQHQLAKTLMPLANMEKSYIRKLAKKHNFSVANKKDSQEICFVDANSSYVDFIEKYADVSSKRGNFVDKTGKKIGEHKGIVHYTIGQRKGLGVSLGRPMFVTKIDAKKNEIILGKEKDQFRTNLFVKNLNFILFEKLEKKIKVTAKLRYQAIPSEAILSPFDNQKAKLEFLKAQKSITPGQAVVFYDKDIVVGGGTIC